MEPRISRTTRHLQRRLQPGWNAARRSARSPQTFNLRQLANLDATPVVLARPTGTDSLAYDADGSRLVAVGHNPTSAAYSASLQTWRVPTGALADEICKDVHVESPCRGVGAIRWRRRSVRAHMQAPFCTSRLFRLEVTSRPPATSIVRSRPCGGRTNWTIPARNSEIVGRK